MFPSPASPSLCFLTALVERQAVVSKLALCGTGTRAVPQRALQSDAGCISLVGTRQSWPASYPCRWQILGGGSQRETACIPPQPCSLTVWPLWVPGSQGPSPTHHGQEEGGWLKDKCITHWRRAFLLCSRDLSFRSPGGLGVKCSTNSYQVGIYRGMCLESAFYQWRRKTMGRYLLDVLGVASGVVFSRWTQKG